MTFFSHASQTIRLCPVVRSLEKEKSSSGFAASLLEKQKNDSISSLDGISDSEAGTSDGDTLQAEGGISEEYIAEEEDEPSPKRLKKASDRNTVSHASVRA